MNKAVAVRSSNKVFLQNYVEKQELQVGVYKVVPASPAAPTHLEDFTAFTLPSKIYGEELQYLSNKVIKSFNTYKKSVGVLLSGLKGTGKSLQMKHIAMNSKMPVLIVDECIGGSELISFLEKIPSSSVVVFDEFEKVYREQSDQESILPLLEGLCSTPHVFVLTVNDEVSPFLVGRPSRIRYNKKYGGLEENLIKEIADDLLIDKSKLDDITMFLSMMENVNMDMVVSFIQDVNLYPEESVDKIIKTFNLDDPMNGDFKVVFGTPGLVVKDQDNIKEIKAKAHDFMKTKYGVKHLDIKEQLYDIHLLKRNEMIMNEVVKVFPDEVAIKMITGMAECNNLNDFLTKMSVEGDIYMLRNYGEDEFIPQDCLFEQFTGNYFRQFGPINIQKNKKGEILLYSTTQLVAVASRQRKTYSRF